MSFILLHTGSLHDSKAGTCSYMTKMNPAFRFPSALSPFYHSFLVSKIRTRTSLVQFKTHLLRSSLISFVLFVHITSPFPLQTLLFDQTAPAHILPCNLPDICTCVTAGGCQEPATLAYLLYLVCYLCGGDTCTPSDSET